MNFRELYYTGNKRYASLLLAKNHILEHCAFFSGHFLFGFSRKNECKMLITQFQRASVIVDAHVLFKSMEVVHRIAKTYKQRE